jgi:drug/metabolite transporter (DMT)-like permease
MADPHLPPPPGAVRAFAAEWRSSAVVVAGAWMVLASAGFAVMIGLIRYVADTGIHAFEIAFFRNLFGLAAIYPWVAKLGLSGLRTQRHPLYAVRALLGVISMLCWFWALSLMPITEAVALSFTAPFFTTILAALLLGEIVRLRRWTAVLVGFAGALVILRPQGAGFPLFEAALVLVSAATQAGSAICIKQLARTEPPNVIVAYMVIYLTPLSILPALLFWSWPSPAQLGWLALLGVAATLAHLCYTRALRAAEASAVAPFDFARLIFTALIGFFVFDQRSDLWTWIGAAIIFASGVYIAHRETRASRGQRSEIRGQKA